jgi:hypothetical protein
VFPGPVSQPAQDLNFLESAADGMRNIEAAMNSGDSNTAARHVKELLSFLSDQQPPVPTLKA